MRIMIKFKKRFLYFFKKINFSNIEICPLKRKPKFIL